MANLEGFANIHIELDESEIKGLHDPKQFEKASYATVVGPVTKFLAFGAAEGLGSLLSARGVAKGYTVKASGRASQNLGVGEFAETSSEHKAHFVYEGSKTQANKFIREGSSGGKGRGIPPISDIGRWLQQKGGINWSIKMPSMQLGPGANISKYRSKEQDQVWSIAYGIQRRGTSTMHKPLYPGNARRYDYVRYAVVKLRMIDQLFAVLKQTQLPFLERILVQYLRTGKWNEGSAYAAIKPKKFML